MVVKPRLAPGRRRSWWPSTVRWRGCAAPIEIRVLDKPLYLLQAP